MTGSFLDTPVVIHVAENIQPCKTRGEALINANQPTTTPYYALRELLAGHVQIICDAHNILLATDNPGEAILALLSRSRAEGRKREGRVKVLAEAVDAIYRANSTSSVADSKREILQRLAIRATGVWRRAHKLKSVQLVQPLACFNGGKITYGSAGELRGPSDSFNCNSGERCAAAAYLYDDQSILKKMIEALHPNNLEPKIAEKNETQQRRKALKELQSKGPNDFSKQRCRALGDAYFAAMCPPGSVIATSNMEDFVPLCSALNKKAVEP